MTQITMGGFVRLLEQLGEPLATMATSRAARTSPRVLLRIAAPSLPTYLPTPQQNRRQRPAAPQLRIVCSTEVFSTPSDIWDVARQRGKRRNLVRICTIENAHVLSHFHFSRKTRQIQEKTIKVEKLVQIFICLTKNDDNRAKDHSRKRIHALLRLHLDHAVNYAMLTNIARL